MQSARTVETLPFLKSAKRVVLLTGTPALSRPKELFSLLTALAPSAKIKMKDFGERYCQCDRWRPYGGQYDGESTVNVVYRYHRYLLRVLAFGLSRSCSKVGDNGACTACQDADFGSCVYAML